MSEENVNKTTDVVDSVLENGSVEETLIESTEETAEEVCNENGQFVKVDEKTNSDKVPQTDELSGDVKSGQSTLLQKLMTIFTDKKKVGVLAIAVIAIFAIFTVMNGPKSVISDVKVTFSGYDERGKATYNEVEVKAKIAQIIAEKNGIKISDVSNITSLWNDLLKNVASGNIEYYKKISAIEQQYSSVVITLDKTSNLTNGDIVTVTIKTGNNSPIKSETKTFTVSGLKPVAKVDIQTILEENTVTSIGYNGYGTLKYDSDIYTVKDSGVKNLQNGQKISVQVKDAYIKKLLNEGKVFDGDTVTMVEVEGLTELKTIKNIADVYSKVLDLAKSKYANTAGSSYTYTIEKKNDFMKYTTSSNKGYITPVSVYKVSEKSSRDGGDKIEEYYVIVGYSNLEIFDNSIILADIQNKTYSHYSKYSDEDSANAYLKSQGFVEYKR